MNTARGREFGPQEVPRAISQSRLSRRRAGEVSRFLPIFSIVGFDDGDWVLALRRYLLSPSRWEESAACSWRLLMERVRGDAGPEGRRIELPCTLRVRESSGIARVWLRAVADAKN